MNEGSRLLKIAFSLFCQLDQSRSKGHVPLQTGGSLGGVTPPEAFAEQLNIKDSNGRGWGPEEGGW